MKTRLLALFTLLSAAVAATGYAHDDTSGTDTASLADLARAADLVALAQVRDTDYLKRRGIPVSGSAFLRVLIPYKTDRAYDLVEVYERGLHENECYFPDVSVFEEGRRYLLFLRRDPDDPERFRGMPQGCALDVLVTQDNRYALRLPAAGIRLSDPLDRLATPITFGDPYAIVADDDLPPALRNAMVDSGQVAPYVPPASAEKDAALPPVREAGGRAWRYTRGIPLEQLRPLLGLEPQLQHTQSTR